MNNYARNEKVLVNTASSIIAEMGNTDKYRRKAIIIKNTSPNALDIITINLGLQQAVANEGVVLGQGETFADSDDSGYQCYQGHITAICATANGQLSIMER